MKCSPCKNVPLNQKRRQAFTLIEMIGVLAVIAILAALLIPKVFSAINDARVNGLCVTCETMKTAVADHYGKYGRLDAQFGTNTFTFPGGLHVGYDRDLMAESLLDKPFAAKIAGGDPSTNAVMQLVQVGSGNAGGVSGSGYLLDGTNNATAGTSFVIETVISGVALADAKDLNDRLDGTSLGSPSGADNRGRGVYAAPVNGLTTV